MFGTRKSPSLSLLKQLAIDNVSEKIMIADAGLTILYINPALLGFFRDTEAEIRTDLPHFRSETLVGSKIDVFHKQPTHQRHMLAKLTAHHAATIPIGARQFDLRVKPLNRAGRRVGFVVEWADATERLLNLDYAAKIAAIGRSQAVIEFLPTGHVLSANETFLRIFGYDLGEIVGRHHGLFVDDAFRDSSEYAEFWATLARGEPIVAEYRRRAKDGREIWVHGSYNPIPDARGVITKIVKFATDVTPRMRAVGDIGATLTQLAAGHLDRRIDTKLAPELDRLRLDLNNTGAMLSRAMRQVGRCSDSIRHGAHEIQGSSDELSRRTERQAASLEQTSTALDGITATVRATSENSRHARDVVGRATENAGRSGEVVRQTVGAMRAIRESSEQIGQIIGVIDEIAFQTNLLALNAGVEAARAGEAGRGFAVVASEVRALAQRSAGAAREIKDLILTSGTRVAEGVALVDETGETLGRIAGEVAEINTIVSAIATSAQEQASGIQDINAAISHMDQMTQQNAAMVEEATAATRVLVQQATELTTLVGGFRLAPEPDGFPSGPPRPNPVPVSPIPPPRRAPRAEPERVLAGC